MDVIATYIILVLSLIGTALCWRRVWQSEDSRFFKISLSLIAAIPFLGPILYVFVDMPPRHLRATYGGRQSPAKRSAFLQRWNDREHIYLGWASFVFWTLAVIAYWMNDWKPGRIRDWHLRSYTDVDVIFFSLLVGAVLTFGAALRAKVILVRRMRETSNFLLQPTGQKR